MGGPAAPRLVMNTRIFALTVLTLLAAAPLAAAAGPNTFQVGDVFLSHYAADGSIDWYRGGVLQATLTSGVGSYILDMAFGPDGTLYAGLYNAAKIAMWAPDGTYLGALTTVGQPGGLGVAPDGTLYVGLYSVNQIQMFDALHNSLGTMPATGSNFLGLSQDGCTLYHADFSSPIYSRDVCTPGSVDVYFAPKAASFDLQIDIVPILGGLVVGSSDGAWRYDSAGMIVQHYGSGTTMGVASDETGTGVWLAQTTGGATHYDLVTASVIGTIPAAGHGTWGAGVYGGGAGPNLPTPELPTLALLGMGVGLVGLVAMRRK